MLPNRSSAVSKHRPIDEVSLKKVIQALHSKEKHKALPKDDISALYATFPEQIKIQEKDLNGDRLQRLLTEYSKLLDSQLIDTLSDIDITLKNLPDSLVDLIYQYTGMISFEQQFIAAHMLCMNNEWVEHAQYMYASRYLFQIWNTAINTALENLIKGIEKIDNRMRDRLFNCSYGFLMKQTITQYFDKKKSEADVLSFLKFFCEESKITPPGKNATETLYNKIISNEIIVPRVGFFQALGRFSSSVVRIPNVTLLTMNYLLEKQQKTSVKASIKLGSIFREIAKTKQPLAITDKMKNILLTEINRKNLPIPTEKNLKNILEILGFKDIQFQENNALVDRANCQKILRIYRAGEIFNIMENYKPSFFAIIEKSIQNALRLLIKDINLDDNVDKLVGRLRQLEKKALDSSKEATGAFKSKLNFFANKLGEFLEDEFEHTSEATKRLRYA